MRTARHRRLALGAGLLPWLPGCLSRAPVLSAVMGSDGPAEGIAVQEPVLLGGHRQWLLMRGDKRANPVLLFLHGGPGSPYMGFARSFQHELEKHFVVVQWDQRGSGKSFPGTPPGSMTVRQFEADTHELVLWLRRRFGRERIYLLGHSWGAYLGLTEARRHPENLHACVGTGQMIDLLRQEQMSHRFVLEQARARGDKSAVEEMQAIGEPPYRDTVRGMKTKYGLLWKYGGMLEGETGPSPFVKAMLMSDDYSFLDALRFARGAAFSLTQLARNEGEGFWRLKAPQPPSYQVPVFFIMGEEDRVTPASLVTEYESRMEAPAGQTYLLKGAGHFAFYTDVERFSAAMLDVLARTYPRRRHGGAAAF